LGFSASVLNLGGGFAVPYVEGDPSVDVEDFIRQIGQALTVCCEREKIPLPAVWMEPGRSIVASPGVTLYTVQSMKSIPGYKDYVAIDGGMTDNPRFALYQSRYTALIANRADQPQDFIATVAGRCCESGDLIGVDMPLQTPQVGDILAVLVTGAYNYSMASNYNRVPRPPVVMLRDGEDRLVVRRETFADIVACDL
jgi:diaminopimelate decarboxylase